MRVLHVYRTYYPDPPGGLQEAIRQIAVSSAPYGIEPRVFALSPTPHPAEIDRPEARVIRCRSWATPASCDLGSIDAFRRFHETVKWANVIHYHFPWPFADLLHLAARPTAPAVMTYHSDIVRQRWLGRAYSPLMHHMLSQMCTIIATSSSYAQTSAVLSHPMHRERVRVIPLGIDERSHSNSVDEGIIQRLGLHDGEPFFLFIGVLRYYKGVHTLLAAARDVKARIIIAGSGPEGAGLMRQADALGTRNVVFAGQISDTEKVALLKACCALVLPSHLRSEAFGMVLVEAAMYGKPMISCEIGTGTSFVNLQDVTGFVVPPENPAALAAAMNRLLDDATLAKLFGKAARQRYEQLFSGEAVGRAYAALYREILEKHA